jgi:hypothetical protein
LSRVYEIIKDCREGGIEELELIEPWRAQRFADELLLQMKRAINDAREIELRAQSQGNTAVELGAYKARVRATHDYAMFLRETGRLTGPRDLKFDAEVGEFWDAANAAFDEHRVPQDVRVAIGRTLGIAVGIDGQPAASDATPPPAHWRPNAEEQEAIGRMKLETRLQEAAEDELVRARKRREFEADLAAGDPMAKAAYKLALKFERED